MINVKEIESPLVWLQGLREKLFLEKKNPFEGTPEYLQPEAGEKGLTEGKRGYLRFLGVMVEEMTIPENANFIVVGAGRGLEAKIIDEALEKREKKGEKLKNVRITTVDINPEILQRLKETTKSKRIKEGLIVADARSLAIPDNSAIMIILGSIGHELGKDGLGQAFFEARRILTPNGVIDFRDFYLPTMQRQLVILKSAFAKRFFSEFNKYFFPQEESDWRRDWKWVEEKKTIECSAIFAHELRQHLRFLKRNYGQWGDKVFDDLADYRELKERYSLDVQGVESVDPNEIMKKLIESTGRPETDYAFSFYLIPDDDDDKLVNKHLGIYEFSTRGEKKKSPLSTSSRIVYIIYKLPKGIIKDKKERDELVKKQYNLIEQASKRAFFEN